MGQRNILKKTNFSRKSDSHNPMASRVDIDMDETSLASDFEPAHQEKRQ